MAGSAIAVRMLHRSGLGTRPHRNSATRALMFAPAPKRKVHMKTQIGNVVLAAALLSFPLGFATGCATENHEAAMTHVDDQSIAARVKTALNHDLDVHGQQINVTALNGQVQL